MIGVLRFRSNHTFSSRIRTMADSAAGKQTVDTTKRLTALRSLMNQKENRVSVLVVPSEDQRMYSFKLAHCHPSNGRLSLQTPASIWQIATRGVRLFPDSMDQPVRLFFLFCVCPSVEPSCPLEGCAVVTLQHALLFTDGRYFLQAEQQLDKCVPSPVLMYTAPS